MSKRSERRTKKNESAEQRAAADAVGTGHRPADVPVKPSQGVGTDSGSDFLTDSEVDKLIVATAAGLHPEPITQAAMDKVVAWAREARIGEAMLGMVLAGHLVPSGTKDGEVAFRFAADLSHEQGASLQRGFRLIEENATAQSESGSEEG